MCTDTHVSVLLRNKKRDITLQKDVGWVEEAEGGVCVNGRDSAGRLFWVCVVLSGGGEARRCVCIGGGGSLQDLSAAVRKL